MTLIEETKEWLKLHEAAGRELEVLACKLRLKTLERCEGKRHKAEFIERMKYKAEENIVVMSHASRRNANMEYLIDDTFINFVTLKAITDFQESRT